MIANQKRIKNILQNKSIIPIDGENSMVSNSSYLFNLILCLIK